MPAEEVFPNRIGRLEYFTWWLILIVGLLLAVVVATYFNGMHWLVVLFVTVDFVGTIMISRSRLHDLGYSGWLAMLLFVPLANLIFVITMLLQKGAGENKYGLPTPPRSGIRRSDSVHEPIGATAHEGYGVWLSHFQ